MPEDNVVTTPPDTQRVEQFLTAPGWAIPVRVQYTMTRLVTTTVLQAAAWNVAPTAGNLLVAWFAYTTTEVPTGPSGWSFADGGDATGETGRFYYLVASGGDAAPLITLAGNTTAIIITAEYSGISPTAPFDQHLGRGNSSGTDSTPQFDGPNISDTPVELWIIAVHDLAGGVHSLPTNGFTLVDQLGSTDSAAWLEKIVTTSDVFTGGDTIASASNWVAAGTTFRAQLLPSATTPPLGYAESYARTTTALGGSELMWKDDGGIEYSQRNLHVRTIYIPPAALALDGASNVTLGSTPSQIAAVQFADAATQGVYTTFMVPLDAAVGYATVRPYWAPNATDSNNSHTVRWKATLRSMIKGDVTLPGTNITWTGVGSGFPKTANTHVSETGAAPLEPISAGAQMRLELQRIGADGADTYVGAVNLLGVRIDYPSLV